jgi:hypothetical protein
MALSNVFPTSTDTSMIFAAGPFKVEVRVLTSDGTDDDTFTTKLQNPIAVSIAASNTDLGGTALAASATLSGKTVTVRDGSNNQSYMFIVVGF